MTIDLDLNSIISVLTAGGIAGLLKLAWSIRDEVRDARKTLGRDDVHPPTGMVGRVEEHDRVIREIRDTLVAEGLLGDRRTGSADRRRRHDDESQP